MNLKNYYQCCGVPCCGNTTIKTPTKLFIHVPFKTKLRNKWLKLARVNVKNVSAKSNLFYCEDHFNLPDDMENYMEYHLLGSVRRILMKPTCLPSKFACQPDRKKRTMSTPRNAYLKRQRKDLVEQLLQPNKVNETEETVFNDTHLIEPLSTGKFAEVLLQGSWEINHTDEDEEILQDPLKSTIKLLEICKNE